MRGREFIGWERDHNGELRPVVQYPDWTDIVAVGVGVCLGASLLGWVFFDWLGLIRYF